MNRMAEVGVFYFRLFLMLIWLILASFLSFPFAIARWKNADNNFFFAQIYGGIARAIMGIQVTVEDAGNLENRPAIFVVNHQSGLDLATLAVIYPRGTVVIAKKEIRRIPVFGLMFEAFGNVLIDRKDRTNALSGLNQAVEEMKQKGLSSWVFPEGTRNPSGEGLLPFKKGAFFMAVQSQSPIVPIVCSRLERLVDFKKRYARSGNLIVRVLPPIPTSGLKISDVDTLREKVRNQMLVALADISAKASKMDSSKT